MSDIYRFKFKSESFDLELESTDKEFINDKMLELIKLAKTPLSEPNLLPPSENSERSSSTSNDQADDAEDEAVTEVSPTDIVNAINESDDHDFIDENILSKTDNLNKILLCYYFINQIAPNFAATTGLIETITDQLGIKIARANVGTKIKNNLKYFTADDVRKKGTVMHYRINRKGIKYMENLFNG